MCGICGFAGEGNKDILIRMRQSMVHRGPDEAGHYFQSGLGLGHRRLKIIDLETGQQPLHNEDKNVWVICNGEIYNFSELRSRLEGRGHVFYTKSDSEVIVHAYEEWGDACIEYLRGMFAFALWDNVKKRVLLVRDRIGIKPLYYALIDDTLVFASEIKALLAHPIVNRDINSSALDMYMRMQFIPSPHTIFKHIWKVAPGQSIVWEHKRLSKNHYWKPAFKPQFKDEKAWLDALEEKILETVQAHLISDVPLGVFLSGGIDSSIVLLAASRIIKKPLKTFTIGFERNDERDSARQIARFCGAEYHEDAVSSGVPEELLKKLVAQLDEPMADSSFLPVFRVSEMAKKEVTVVLAGDGSDEFFGGYWRYSRWLDYQRRWGSVRIPRFISDQAKKIVNRIPFKRQDLMTMRRQDIVALSCHGLMRFAELCYGYYSFPEYYLSAENLYGNRVYDQIKPQHAAADIWERMDDEARGSSVLHQAQYADILTYLPEDILMKVDKMSMLNSLEVRVPLIDHELCELATRVPEDLKIRSGNTKYILKRLLERWGVPAELVYRTKMGFGQSEDYWLNDESWARACLDLRDGITLERGIFRREGIETLIAQKNYKLIWNLWVFEIWARHYLS